MHRRGTGLDVLSGVRVREIVRRERGVVTLSPGEPYADVRRRASAAREQEVFPVVDEEGVLAGIVTWHAIESFAAAQDESRRTAARDVMQPPVSIALGDDLRTAAERIVANHLREIPVADDDGRVVGLFDENDIAKAYVRAVGEKRS